MTVGLEAFHVTDERPNNAENLGGARRAPRAFTLIEVLVVIFILAVLAAIVASVAGYVMSTANARETAAIQKTVMDAIQAFHDAGNPNDLDPNNRRVYPPGPADPNDPNSGIMLVGYLTGTIDGNSQTPRVKAATEALLKLPRESWNETDPNAIKDGWGHAMRYEAKGGLGGKPVVISAGPDGRFGTADLGHIDDLTKEEDNIRSDESQ